MDTTHYQLVFERWTKGLILFFGAMFLFVALSAGRMPRQPDSRGGSANRPQNAEYCPLGERKALNLSESGLDGYSFDSTIGTLRRRCPAARDTVISGEVTSFAALLLPFRGASVIAEEWAAKLDANRSADVWIIVGDSIVLPGGVTLSTEWGSLRRSYGRAVGDLPGEDWETSVYFVFCSMPRMVFELPNLIRDSTADLRDPSSLPPTARPLRAYLVRERKSLCNLGRPGNK